MLGEMPHFGLPAEEYEPVVDQYEVVGEQDEFLQQQQQQAVVLEESGSSGDVRPEPLRENGKQTENISLQKSFIYAKSKELAKHLHWIDFGSPLLVA